MTVVSQEIKIIQYVVFYNHFDPVTVILIKVIFKICLNWPHLSIHPFTENQFSSSFSLLHTNVSMTEQSKLLVSVHSYVSVLVLARKGILSTLYLVALCVFFNTKRTFVIREY